MQIKTYRAKSLQEALRWIRSDLGPEAAVLQTREVTGGMLSWLQGRQLEVTAGVGVSVPSRFDGELPPGAAAQLREVGWDSSPDRKVGWDSSPDKLAAWDSSPDQTARECHPTLVPAAHEQDFRTRYRNELLNPNEDAPSLVEELCQRSTQALDGDLPVGLRELFTELIDAEVDEESARELIHRVHSRSTPGEMVESSRLKARLARVVAEEIDCTGPIQLSSQARRVIAFVGPTGVGKTTTIAKLAADFYLRQQRRVGLITVDTFRVAAVDQLQTYADIIDLPMEVVTNSHDLRLALAKLSDMELVLLDTAGHSPCDDAKIDELRILLRDAQADDVQLVVSSVASASSVKQAIATFAAIGATRLVLTKLDEAGGWGHLWPVLRRGKLSLSYVTHGQSVPDDIAPANARKLARQLLKVDRG